MQKNIQIAVTIIILVLVIGGTFFISNFKGSNIMKEITYEEYTSVIKSKKPTYVFVGEKGDDYDALKDIVKTKGIKSYYINIKDLSTKEKKDIYNGDMINTLFIYENGKAQLTYNKNFNSYELINILMNNNYIEKSYIEISVEDYLKIIKEDKYNFMFIGSNSCGYCTQFKESINKALKDYSFNIYYLDVASITADEQKKLYATDNYFTKEEWGTPLNFLYKNGKRIDVLNGYVEKDKLVEFLKKNKVV